MQLCILQTYSLPALQSSILSYAQKPEVYFLWSELSLTSFSKFIFCKSQIYVSFIKFITLDMGGSGAGIQTHALLNHELYPIDKH